MTKAVAALLQKDMKKRAELCIDIINEATGNPESKPVATDAVEKAAMHLMNIDTNSLPDLRLQLKIIREALDKTEVIGTTDDARSP